MTNRQGLDDPRVASAAWARFRRLMAWMAFWGAVCAGAVLAILLWAGAPMALHLMIATFLGVWGTFMLGTALMTLMFLSSGTGHDEQVDDRFEREWERHDS